MRLPPVAALLAVLSWLAAAQAHAAEITLTVDAVDVVRPPRGEPGLGFLCGKALAHEGELELFDVMFVIDTSGSTAEPSGLGKKRSRWLSGLPGARRASESILAAEVQAIESLLDGLDPRTTRVGLISFAGGENPNARDAWVEAPLTSNYQEVRRALADRLLVEPVGGTNLRAGILLGAIELLGTRSAESTRRKNAARHIVVLTDGLPTIPENRGADAAYESAETLAKRGVRIHVFAIGPEADDTGREIEPIAEVTHGEYHAVDDLSQLGKLLSQIQFRSLRELRVLNKSTGARAVEMSRDDEDGSWAALVPFAPGVNKIEVVAVAADGRERRLEREVTFGDVLLQPEQIARRDRLMQLHVGAEQRARSATQKPKPSEKELRVEPDVAAPPKPAPK